MTPRVKVKSHSGGAGLLSEKSQEMGSTFQQREEGRLCGWREKFLECSGKDVMACWT